jgi:hypothetical protein
MPNRDELLADVHYRLEQAQAIYKRHTTITTARPAKL